MLFEDFKSRFDYPGSIVLLEGKRIVLPEDQPLLINLGKKLASDTKNIIFRSGNAPGADELFSKGVDEVDKKRLEIIGPYESHRSGNRYGEKFHSLDQYDLVSDDLVVLQTKQNLKNRKMVDAYVSGQKSKLSIKASYLLRDTVKVLGIENHILPCTFGIFYDDPNAPKTGGTGHTMAICELNNIEIVTQEVWFSWI